LNRGLITSKPTLVNPGILTMTSELKRDTPDEKKDEFGRCN